MQASDLFQTSELIKNQIFGNKDALASQEAPLSEGVSRQAMVASLANNASTDYNDLMKGYETQFQYNKSMMEQNRRLEVLSEASNKRQQDIFNRHISVRGDAGDNGDLANAVDLLLLNGLAKPEEDISLEEEAGKTLGDLSATTEAGAEWAGIPLDDNRTVLDWTSEQWIKRAIVQKDMDALVQEKEPRNDLHGFVDWSIMSILPFIDNTAKTENFFNEGVQKRFYDWTAAGDRQNEEMRSLERLPLADWLKAYPIVRENIKKSSTDFGYYNRTQEIDLLSAMVKTPTAVETNVFGALDLIDFTPGIGALSGSAQSIKSLPKTLRATGNKAAEVDVLATTIDRMERNGTAQAAEELGVTFDDLVEEGVPSALNPDKNPNDGPSMAITANEAYSQGKAVMEELGVAGDVSRLSGPELQEALDAALDRAEKQFGKKRIVDVSVVNKTQSSGIQSPTLQITLGKADGTGFVSDRTLREFAQKVGVNPEESDILVKTGELSEKVKAKTITPEQAADEFAESFIDEDVIPEDLRTSKEELSELQALFGNIADEDLVSGDAEWFDNIVQREDAAIGSLRETRLKTDQVEAVINKTGEDVTVDFVDSDNLSRDVSGFSRETAQIFGDVSEPLGEGMRAVNEWVRREGPASVQITSPTLKHTEFYDSHFQFNTPEGYRAVRVDKNYKVKGKADVDEVFYKLVREDVEGVPGFKEGSEKGVTTKVTQIADNTVAETTIADVDVNLFEIPNEQPKDIDALLAEAAKPTISAKKRAEIQDYFQRLIDEPVEPNKTYNWLTEKVDDTDGLQAKIDANPEDGDRLVIENEVKAFFQGDATKGGIFKDYVRFFKEQDEGLQSLWNLYLENTAPNKIDIAQVRKMLEPTGTKSPTAKNISDFEVEVYDIRLPEDDLQLRKISEKVQSDPALQELGVLINPTRLELDEMWGASGGVVRITATRNGNVVAYPGSVQHTMFETATGFSIKDGLGRGFYAPETNLSHRVKTYYNPRKHVSSINNFRVDENRLFSLDKRTVSVDLQKTERLRNLESQKSDLSAQLKDPEGYAQEVAEMRELGTRPAAELKQSAELHAAAIRGNRPEIQKQLKDVRSEIKELKGAMKAKKQPTKSAQPTSDPNTGEFYLNVEIPVIEKDFFSKLENTTAPFNFGRLLLGGRQLSADDLHSLAVMSGARRNKILASIKKHIVPKFAKLTKVEEETLGTILKKGEREQKWYTKSAVRVMYSQLLETDLIPDRFVEAYEAYRSINDLEYFLRNSEMYSLKNAQGYQTASFTSPRINVPEGNARVHRTLPDGTPAGRIYNASEDAHLREGDWTPQRYREEGYYLLEYDHPLELIDGTRVANILVKKNSVEVKPLRETQIGYKAGGHRIYGPNVKYFAKQAKFGKQPDTGEMFKMNPNTMIGGEFKADVDKWIFNMNQALEVAKRLKLGELTSESRAIGRINRILDGDGYPSGEELLDMIDEGKIDVDQPFETVYDRQLPSAYDKVEANSDFLDPSPGNIAYLETRGRLYYSGKGEEALMDYQGKELTTLDPFDSLNRSIGDIANIIGFSNYKHRAMEKWVNTYREYLDIRTGANTSVGRIFLEETFRESTPPAIRNAANQERSVIRRVLNWTSEEDMAYNNSVRNVMEFVDGDGNTKWRRDTAKALNWTREADFLKRLRGAAFDMKLGLFNIGQFPMQIQTMAAAISVDTGNGLNAMRALPALRVFTSGKQPNLGSYRKWAEKNFGSKPFGFDSVEDFVEMSKELRKGGFTEVEFVHVLSNDFGTNSAMALNGSKFSAIKNAGRFFFYESERWNRTLAFTMAWKRARKKHPSLQGQDFLEKVYQGADDLSLNMTEASSAAWQKGLASIPTQFWSYQVRMMEAMLGKQFTPTEKIRLIVGQGVLYGSAGLPFISYMSDEAQKRGGETYTPTDFIGTLDRGIIDAALYHGTGADVKFSERAGTGSFWTDTVRELFSAGRYGDTSTAEFFGGATASIAADVGTGVVDLIKYSLAESGHGTIGPLSQRSLENIGRNISSVNNSLKAYMGWRYGVLTSAKGNVVLDGVNKPEAVALAFGIPLAAQDSLTAKIGWLQHRTEIIDDAVSVMRNYRIQLAEDWGDRERITAEMNTFAQLLPPEIREEVIKKVEKETPLTVYESVSRSVEEKYNKDEYIKKLDEELNN